MNQYAVFDEIKETPLNQKFTPGLRIELFLNQICGGFEFSEGMRSRSIRTKDRGLLKEYFCSVEDIFLFKSITGRKKDLIDMQIIANPGLYWNTIADEFVSQIENRSLVRDFLGTFNDSVRILKEDYKTQVPVSVLRKINDL